MLGFRVIRLLKLRTSHHIGQILPAKRNQLRRSGHANRLAASIHC